MDVVYECCCGLDVHAKTVVACLVTKGRKEIRTFATMTDELLQLGDWLSSAGCTHVAIESTGVYWKPVFNILEGLLTVILVNARHIKAVPGRKTDVRDCEWLADLLRHGLLKASFIPPVEIRELRELVRYRQTILTEHTAVANRIQKLIESANIKLGQVASDVLGLSGRLMLRALAAGEVEEQKGRVTACIDRLPHARTALGAHGIAHARGRTGSGADARRNAYWGRSGGVRRPVRAGGGGVARKYSGDRPADRADDCGRDWRGYEPLSFGQALGKLGRRMSGQSRVGGQAPEWAADQGE